MFKENSFIMYNKEVCKIKKIERNKYTNLECYIISPVNDDSLIISVPVNSNKISNLMSKKEIDDLIIKIPSIKVLDVNMHNIESIYLDLLHSNNREDLIKIIKTTYLRNENRKENKRSIGQKDKEYFEKAEKSLYSEIAISLNITYEEAKNYVIKKVENEKNI